MGTTYVTEAISPEAVRIEQEGLLRQEEEKRKRVQIKYEQAALELQTAIVKESSAIIRAQLELCRDIVCLEQKRAQMIIELISGARVLIPYDTPSAVAMIKDANALPKPLGAVECLKAMKKHLLQCPEQFNLILNAGKRANLITDAEIRQLR